MSLPAILPRQISPRLLEAMTDTPVVLLAGPAGGQDHFGEADRPADGYALSHYG